MPRLKVGLALGSGGFRGPALVGVIDTLLENNIPIDYIAGSSIGALVGAYYALYGNSEKLMKNFFGKQREKLKILTDISRRGGLLTGSTLEKMINKGLGQAEFKQVKIPIKLVATDIIFGSPFVFEKGNLASAIRASLSIPFTFRPMKFKDRLLSDGGISMPIPEEIVRSMGADIVISINLYNRYHFSQTNPSTTKVVMRCAEITIRNLAETGLKKSDVVIEPDTSNLQKISRLKKYWDDTIMQEMLTAGRVAALKSLPDIKKKLGLI